MQQGDVAITSTLAIYGLTVKVQLRAACGIHAGNQHIKWTDGEGAATCRVWQTRWQSAHLWTDVVATCRVWRTR